MRTAASLFFWLSAVSQSVSAVSIYACIDAHGNKTYSDHCPPEMLRQQTQYGVFPTPQDPSSLDDLTASAPVTLYSVGECDACDLVRNYLNQRGIPFSEKNAAEAGDTKKELRDKSGHVTVPITTIGAKIVRGYDRWALKDAIDAAGYPDANTALHEKENGEPETPIED